MTLKLVPHRIPRGGWDNQFNVFGPDLRELFVKRATLLRSVTIVFNEDTKVENHEYVAKLGGFDAIPLLRQLTNLELTNVCLRGLTLLATLQDCTSQIISLKLCRLKLCPIHRYDPWRFYDPWRSRTRTHDESYMLDMMTMIGRMTNLCRLHITCGKLEDHHISVLHPICLQREELELIGELVHWKGQKNS